ncbi:molybdenum cofactor biosynthesis protein MoaE [Christiangramia portivictoriae]|uniref:molybdenum cofactor biosynthesis protein MoaE n=1 Tax=Christiangramia portivictoriae TaxID=326069 RepID=UPI00040D4DF7|nr:molybdenum cofactor biosynthesis protein MoaE [Christiangramia portivictoriae]
MSHKKPKKVFIQGAIPPEKIAKSIANHQSKTNIGAHSIFLGQIRADEVDGNIVQAIEYSAYEEMAEQVFHEIRETAFSKFDITCAHIYHSMGRVNAGEICLFVFTSSEHRKIAIEACNFFVEEIKAKVPIFGKELFEDESHQWKVNK